MGDENEVFAQFILNFFPIFLLILLRLLEIVLDFIQGCNLQKNAMNYFIDKHEKYNVTLMVK